MIISSSEHKLCPRDLFAIVVFVLLYGSSSLLCCRSSSLLYCSAQEGAVFGE